MPQHMTDLSTVTTLDITRDVCPMTFVRTRIALDRLAPGDVLEVRLRGAEPLRNVTGNAVALGHALLETTLLADDVTMLRIRKQGRALPDPPTC